MNKYSWEIYSFSGFLEAEDLFSAVIAAIREYWNAVPYPGTFATRLDIYVKQITEEEYNEGTK